MNDTSIMKIKIISQNFRRRNLNNEHVINTLKNTDILVAQEVNLPTGRLEIKNVIHKLETDHNCKVYYSNKVRGVHIATIVKNTLDIRHTQFKELIEGRAIEVKIKNENYEHSIINVYAPSFDIHENEEFCTTLFNKIKHINSPIVIGDWNSVLNDEMCNKGQNSFHKRLSKLIEHLFTNWIDIHTVIPGEIKYTFTKKQYRARHDRIYTDESNIQNILSYQIKPITFSDHDQLLIHVKWGDRPVWGKGIWKLNVKLLEDIKYNQLIVNDIEISKLNTKFHEPMEAWDILKKTIKNTSINYAIEKQKLNKDELKTEYDNLERIIGQIDNASSESIHLLDEKETIEKKVEKLEREKNEGERVRAKIEKIKYDERSSKYFFKKEKKTGQNGNITILKNSKDEEIEEEDEIIKEIENFYENLYKTNQVDKEQVTENLKFIKNELHENEQKELNEFFTSNEIKGIIKSMDNEKSPGKDGLPKEFYLHFFDNLEEILVELFNNIKFSSKQPKSHKNAIIKLIYKKHDQRQLKNWRPISLLNVDYKILSKMLTKRLSKYIDTIIPIEQKCGVKGRQLTDIIRNLDTIRNYSDKGYLVLLDQTKAFDRVNHDYLFAALEAVGMNGSILDITKEMYNNITSQVEINGRLTKKIQIERGVRQGCPYSMLLFVISTIPLIEMVKNAKSIKGHTTKLNHNIKVQSYADDTTIIIQNPRELDEVEEIFRKHAMASEAEINEEKTEILRLGKPHKNENEKFKSKIKQKVKILGAYFCENKTLETKENLKKPIELLQKWTDTYNSYITIVGKILNINTYIYSTIFNAAWLIDTQNEQFTTLIKEIAKYLHPTRGMETYDLVSKQKKEGGLNLINIKERIETLKIKEMLNVSEENPETDNIMYELGIYQKTIYGKSVTGPRIDETPVKTLETIKTITPKMEVIRNYKKRHKKLVTKDLQSIFFPKREISNYIEIIQSEEPKLIEVNYKTKYGILPVLNYNKCYLCGMEQESIEHLMVNCCYLDKLRTQVNDWLSIIGKSELNKDSIITMTGITDNIENQIISRYKNVIWLTRNNAKNKIKKTNITGIIRILDSDIKFYIKNISNNIGTLAV